MQEAHDAGGPRCRRPTMQEAHDAGGPRCRRPTMQEAHDAGETGSNVAQVSDHGLQIWRTIVCSSLIILVGQDHY
ncbi:hypothetical protein HAV15_005948 [Penicillium sp. str. |nr:hypothetical protein HAV15_005948 [Penicillium sp. str. \